MSNKYQLPEVEVSLSPQDRFAEFLQSRGKRMTQQRQVIIQEVFNNHDHFDADALCEQLQQADRGVGRATVYRTLNELEDAGLLRKMQLSGRSVYEHDYGYPQHDHMHCERCDQLIEFHSDKLKALREAVAREHGFRATGHRLIILGVCSECSARRRRIRPLELV